MANSNPPAKNQAFTFSIALQDYASPGNFKANPTIASGDFKIKIDDAAVANLTNLPTVTPAGGIWVKIVLTAAEMNGDNIGIQGIDQTGTKEWADYALTILTT